MAFARRNEGSRGRDKSSRFNRNDSSRDSRPRSNRGGSSSRFSRDSGSRDNRGSSERRFERSSRPGSRDSRPSSRDIRRMHKVVCDKCKSDCEVPFLPMKDDPVYCSDCFRKSGKDKRGGSNDSNCANVEKELTQINKKLDIIIKALDL